MNKNSKRYRFILHENFNDKGVIDSKYYTVQKRKNILGFSYWKDIKSQKIIRDKFFEFKTTFRSLKDAQKFIDDILFRDIPRNKTLKTIIYNKMKTKFQVGDKAYKPKGYKFPCTIVGVFKTIEGNIRVVGEMDGFGLLHIFNEEQLEHYGK